MEKLHHSSTRRGFPEFASGWFFKVLVDWVVLNEQERLLIPVAVLEDEVGPKSFAEIGHDGLYARRNGLAFDEKLGAILEQLCQHMANPGLMDGGLFATML
jgi:hypothetical protein